MRCGRWGKGPHELDPDAPFLAPNGTRCRLCYLALHSKYNRSEKGKDRDNRYIVNLPGAKYQKRILGERRRMALKRQKQRRAEQ